MKIRDGFKILFFGDSITDVAFNRRQSLRLHGRNNYPLQVAKELNKSYKNLKFFYRGVASDRTYNLYDRMTKDCIALKPDVIIMLIGVNDAWEHYVPEQYPELRRPMEPHMKEIYRRIHDELDDVQLLVLLPFLIDTIQDKKPFHKVLNVYRELLRSMAAENGAEVGDLQLAFDIAAEVTPAAKLSVDGIHPTAAGHAVIAREVLSHIE